MARRLPFHRPVARDIEETSDEIRAQLEAELRRVRTPEDAERIVRQLERLARGTTEVEQAKAALADPAPAAQEVKRAAETAPAGPKEAAAVIAETAQQAATQTPEGLAAMEAAQEALQPAADDAEPRTAWGAELLKDAVLRHLGPLQKLDAKVFLAINNAPHPAWSDRLADRITVWTTGGWIWAGGVLLARLFGVRGANRGLIYLLPSLCAATWIVEFPIKAFFRRRRPFIDVVRALVVGKKPGSWSFPSGHTASSFACAWVLSVIWPRAAPYFFALATSVGFSRIYVGAHYPGDVTSGAFFGMMLSELARRLTRYAMRRTGYKWA